MKHMTGNFQTVDGLTLHTESWLPDGEPKAVVLLVHGYAEHIGRYQHVAEYLVVQNYAFYGLDHRGHGRSAGERVYFNSIDDPVNDLRLYFEQIKAAHPGKKIFIYGHSMGSIITLEFALRYQSELAGIIISGAGITGDETVSPMVVTVFKMLNRVLPKNRVLPPIASTALSHNPAVAAAYDNDPLVDRGSWRVRTGTILVQTIRLIRERLDKLTLPMLILHGSDDIITPVSGSHLIQQKASSKDKTLKIYPGLLHEIHNEAEQVQVLADITEWLNTRA